MKLTDAQEKRLKWLQGQGGEGVVDKFGRVLAGGETAPQGASPAWLKLIAFGLIEGRRGRLFVTEYGRAHLGL